MRSGLSRTVIIILVWCAGLGAAAQFGKVSVLFTELAARYAGYSTVSLGLIVSIVGMVGLVLGTTAGLFVSRLGPRRVIVAALLVGAGVSAVQAFGLPYPALIASRVAEGVSHLAIVVVGPSLMAAMATDANRGLVMTFWASFFGVAYALLALFGPWEMTGLFLGHAIWMLGLAVALALLLDRDPAPVATTATDSFVMQHVAIYRSPYIAAPASGFFCYTFLYVAFLTLLPPEVPPAATVIVAFGMPLISIVVSLTLGVFLLRWMRAYRLVQAGYVAALPGIVVLALGWGDAAVMTVGALWLSSALGIVQGASFATIPELNTSVGDRVKAAGAIAQLGNLGTTTGTPVLAYVLTRQGPWGLALVAVCACLLGIALHAVQARRRQMRST